MHKHAEPGSKSGVKDGLLSDKSERVLSSLVKRASQIADPLSTSLPLPFTPL